MAESSESKDFSVDNPELISSRQRRLWTLFQQTATSLTHIYKCKSSSKCQISTSEDQEAWLAFQSAASALTSLYRESADILSSLEKNNANATNSVAKEDSNVANNESYVTMTNSASHTVSKLKRSWSDWPDDHDFGDGGGLLRPRLFLCSVVICIKTVSPCGSCNT